MAQTKITKKKSFFKVVEESSFWKKSSGIILPLILGIIIFLLWQNEVLHSWFKTDTFVLPVPTKINSIIFDIRSDILANTISTVEVAFFGLLFGSIIGYLVAILASVFPKIGTGGLSVIGAFASIPVVALAPVMNNWTKDISRVASVRSMVAKIIVVALIAAANMCLNAYRGLSEVQPFSEDLMAIYGAKKHVTLFKIRIPNSLPFVFTALKVAVPASIMTAVVTEYFAEFITGVGRAIRENIVLAQYSTAWAYIIIACLIGVVSYVILMAIQSFALRKYPKV